MPRGRGGGLPPVRKSLGQHFLTDRRLLSRIADALEPVKGTAIVEIGPGRGALTELLLERAQTVVAVEYDRMLAEYLRARFAGDERLRIVEADVLTLDLGAVANGPYVLVGNVPYYITTPIIFQSLRPRRAERSVFLVQREVASRLSASPGSGEYGALSVNVQAVAQPEILFRVPAGSFSPPPKVESAVVRITPREVPLVQPGEEEALREMVQAIFGYRRKQMRRVLREMRSLSADEADAALAAAGIDGDSRAETLAPEAFVRLLWVLPRR